MCYSTQMNARSQFRFSIASILWLMVCVAAYFAGRYSMTPTINLLKAEREQERSITELRHEKAQLQVANAQARLLKAELQLERHKAPTVVDIADGDTVTVVEDSELTRVRVVGIDCPESNQPLGDEAAQFTAEFCHNNSVQLIGDETDRYGRRLADVCVDGNSLREALLSAGLAWHYKK